MDNIGKMASKIGECRRELLPFSKLLNGKSNFIKKNKNREKRGAVKNGK